MCYSNYCWGKNSKSGWGFGQLLKSINPIPTINTTLVEKIALQNIYLGYEENERKCLYRTENIAQIQDGDEKWEVKKISLTEVNSWAMQVKERHSWINILGLWVLLWLEDMKVGESFWDWETSWIKWDQGFLVKKVSSRRAGILPSSFTAVYPELATQQTLPKCLLNESTEGLYYGQKWYLI